MRGVRNRKTKAEVIEALRTTRGVVEKAIKLLGIGHTPMWTMIANDPSLKAALDQIRAERVDTHLELAESTLEYAMSNRDKDIHAAIKAAMFMLNNKGEKLGYKHPSARKAEEIDITIKTHLQEMNEKMERAHAIITQEV